jgi:aryl carrier-like protein
METAVAAVWAKVLQVEKVGRQDNFFSLGGHSLLAVKVIAKLRERGLQCDMGSLFLKPTVAGFAAVVNAQKSTIEIPVNRIPEKKPRTSDSSGKRKVIL